VSEGYAVADSLAPAFEAEIGADTRVDSNPELASAGLTEAVCVFEVLAGFGQNWYYRTTYRHHQRL
jgi:hypothetical protein